MPHPNGSRGNPLPVRHTFQQAYAHVGVDGISFHSTTAEAMTATRGVAQDGVTTTLILSGERHVAGRVCEAC